MNKHFNLEKNSDCTRCYQCVRECPTNSIKIIDGKISKCSEMCINCANCQKVCAKDIHCVNLQNDNILEFLLKNKTIALLDETFFIGLENVTFNQIENALYKVGFKYIETPFDGMYIYNLLMKNTFKSNPKYWIDSDCIPITNYIRKFKPNFADNISPYKSSIEISAQITKETYGSDFKIILISNCIGDFELIKSSEYIDLVITSSELYSLFDYRDIKLANIKTKHVKKKIVDVKKISNFSGQNVSGINNCKQMLDCVEKINYNMKDSISFSACKGTCFNTGAISDNISIYEKEQLYLDFLKDNFTPIMAKDDYILKFGNLNRFKTFYKPVHVQLPDYSEETIESVLKTIKIDSIDEEQNCNACGYDSCRTFAVALLNDMAAPEQCVPYLTKVNKEQAERMSRMLDELNEAFSLTIPDNRLEKKLKTTSLYTGVYNACTDYFEVTNVISKGLYLHIINCLKLAADLKDKNVFALIGIDKNILVQSILYHCNAKTQPILCTGDIVRYSELFEDEILEAARSADFAKNYYNINEDVCDIIYYHKHEEDDISIDFPKHLLPIFRLFRVIDAISYEITISTNDCYFEFEFVDFILYVNKITPSSQKTFVVDLYRKFDLKSFECFVKE